MDEVTAAIGAGLNVKALAMCRRGLVQQPDNVGLLHLCGALQVQTGDYESARTLLNRLLSTWPDHDDARYRLGLACMASQRDLEAIAAFQRLPRHAFAQTCLGRVYVQQGAHAAAVLALEKAVALGAMEERANLANSCMDAGLAARAEVMMRDLLVEAAPNSDQLHIALRLGRHLMAQRRWDEILTLYTQLAQRPELATAAWTVIAAAHLERGDVEAAIGVFPPELYQTNWSYSFAVVSIAHFRRALGGSVLERPAHPYPDSDIGFSASSLGHYGRFTHQLNDYLFLRWQSEQTGVPLETPEWVGRYVFDLDDPSPTGRRKALHKQSPWIEAQVATRGAEALAGYDFYSPGGFASWKAEHGLRARQLFRVRPVWLPKLQPALSVLRARGNTIVAMHFRRTDYLAIAAAPPVRWYIEWLRAVWPTLDKPVLYIASDDLEAVKADFAEFQPCGLDDVATPWPGLEWLQDFFVLMHADAIATSLGGYGRFASILNATGRIFMQPDFGQGRLQPFSPLHDGAA